MAKKKKLVHQNTYCYVIFVNTALKTGPDFPMHHLIYLHFSRVTLESQTTVCYTSNNWNNYFSSRGKKENTNFLRKENKTKKEQYKGYSPGKSLYSLNQTYFFPPNSNGKQEKKKKKRKACPTIQIIFSCKL